ncbi:MAG TPA: SagB/ThcOx family dehydrogenase [Longimicrobiaceae bacterium]|nr:SagB/ThcOx family dehydrogenase [Longimicrobiaceae bacterium]
MQTKELIAVRDLAFLEFKSGENGSHGVTLVNPLEGQRFALRSAPILEVLTAAVRPAERAELAARLAERLELEPAQAEALVDGLVERGVLERVAEGAEDNWLEMWHHYNWEVASLYHFLSRGIRFADVDRAERPPMDVREDVIEEYRRGEPFPYRDVSSAGEEDAVVLPRGEAEVDWPLGPTLLKRKTLRTWAWRRLSQQELGNLLWYGLRPIGENRAVVAADPGFSRVEPLLTHFAHLGVWVLPIRVDGIENAIYRYDPVGHRLLPRGTYPDARSLEALCVGQVPLRDASVVVVLSGMFEEFMWRYRHNRAYRVLWLEVGQMMQNLHLTATGMRLRPFLTPALRDSQLDELLGLDGYREGALYLSAFG